MIKEIEVKIQLKKGENIAKKLRKIGGEKEKSYTQTTYGFFSEDSVKKGIFPRIRIESKSPVLTVKVRKKNKTKYFERDEYSIKISSLKEGIKILQLLGYKKIRKFTKFREHWSFRNRLIKEVTVDRLYFGRFSEIEGPKSEIEKMIKELGWQNRKRIAKAYLAVEDEINKAKNNSK